MNRVTLLSYLACGLFLSLATNAFGQVPDAEELEKLDQIFQRDIPENAPGAAVSILRDGKLIYERYGGFSNLEQKTKIDQHTRFNIASNGKQFTALAILLLEEEGKLALNDDIRQYFPNFYKNLPQTITIEQLLTHRSGIRDVYELWGLQGLTWWKEKLSNTDAMDLLKKQEELNFESGSSFLYSNSNYILLAEIVSKVSGKDFVTFTEEMFDKLGMTSTSFTSDYERIEPPIAQPYFNFDKWYNYNWTCNINGDGNLFSSMKDQIRWENIIQNGQNNFVSDELIEKSQKLISGFQDYGYGLDFGTFKNHEYRFHEGSTGAWKATTIRFEQPKLTIVTLTNSGKITTDNQSREMGSVFLNKENSETQINQKPTQNGKLIDIPQIVGTYVLGANDIFQFEERDAELFLIRHGRNDTKLVRESDNVFHQWNDATFKQEFITNDDGSIQAIFYHPSHQAYSMTKEKVSWGNFDYNSLNGKYINSELDVAFLLRYTSAKKYEVTFGEELSEGILVSPEKLFMDGYIAEINGTNSEIFLNGNRIRKIRFKRQRAK